VSSGFAPVDAGVESNRLLADGTGSGGVSLLARLDRDVLAEPDVGTVVIDAGLADLLSSSSVTAEQLSAGLAALDNQLFAFGATVIIATITPCSGSGGLACGSAADGTRVNVNQAIGTPFSPEYCPADFAGTVGDTNSPQALQASPTNYDTGDHVNVTSPGYAALTGPVGGCGLFTLQFP
jgi:hypothetical protein